jgi:spoIIIJ-associated protein
MEWVETTGPTVEAAREAALEQLGVDEGDAELIVVTEPRSGLFGFGRVEARVRARVRPALPRPKRAGRRRSESRGQGRVSTSKAERTGGEPSGASRSRRGRARPAAEVTANGAAVPGEVTRGDVVSERPGPSSEEASMSIEQQAEAVERFVAGVVERFGFDDARTSARVEEGQVLVDVTGEGLGLLIGPRGRTLDALQELARTVLQRRGEDTSVRVIVDVGGFRAKRAAALEAFARRVAAEVVAQGVPQALEAMSPADRKIVHDTVTTIPGVHTSSEGVEPHRYVVIHPDVPRSAEGSDDV